MLVHIRLNNLVDDEVDADEEFWGQDAFKEAADDAEYEAEEDVIDEFDSDFDEDEANAEEEAPEDVVERVKKKRLLPPGSKPSKTDKRKAATPKTKGLDIIEAAVAAAVHAKDEEPTAIQLPEPNQEGTDINENYTDLEGEKTVRKSTRTAVVIRQAEREALRAAMQATTIKPVKKKREGERRITQEDMLLEAAQTEILNQQHLEQMLAREEEVKQKAIVHKAVYSGPQIRFYSRDGENLLEFMGDVSEWQQLFEQPRQSQKRSHLCAVTGLPAKYLDPLTRLPYATIDAFKMIRERIAEDDIGERTPGKNLRSARSVSGRLCVRSSGRKARRSGLYSSPHGSNRMEARAASVKSFMSGVAQQTYDLEASPINSTVVNLSSRLLFHSNSPHQPTQSRALSDGSQDIELVENEPHSAYAPPSTYEAQSEARWVEIPPPKEGPSEDDYLLDDLTSLDFGPILAAQHDFTSQSRREYELDIGDPTSEGMFLPLDVLPMPPEFSSNVVL
ncbi:hypothetical protein GOP47_0001896 [Adiantum capillus-veneris]|uniref:Vps72/YL1 C-terminal domain-containing protein n=1 Tax=Adiantum capillus-veneris TaxID=13818 RepID=A0A9D4V9K2_ADICA|nr:hypothetical protein GOP47_0001896 [Adiantum capillus-veneris]